MRAEPGVGGGMSAVARLRVDDNAESLIAAIAADGSLYPIEKLEAHRRGARHLAVSVFVMDGDALLLQRRAAGKYHCAGLWANSCCSHPAWGETPAAGASRRLYEELGVVLPLRACGVLEYEAQVTDGLTESERVHVFHAKADARALRLEVDPTEVSETRWAEVAELRREANVGEDRFAPWFRIYLDRWDELGL
jgi:isopentenyl-diphosphate delta-isomerase